MLAPAIILPTATHTPRAVYEAGATAPYNENQKMIVCTSSVMSDSSNTREVQVCRAAVTKASSSRWADGSRRPTVAHLDVTIGLLVGCFDLCMYSAGPAVGVSGMDGVEITENLYTS